MNQKNDNGVTNYLHDVNVNQNYCFSCQVYSLVQVMFSIIPGSKVMTILVHKGLSGDWNKLRIPKSPVIHSMKSASMLLFASITLFIAFDLLSENQQVVKGKLIGLNANKLTILEGYSFLTISFQRVVIKKKKCFCTFFKALYYINDCTFSNVHSCIIYSLHCLKKITNLNIIEKKNLRWNLQELR